MKTLSIVLVMVALGAVAASPSAAQVRIGVGIEVTVPPPPFPPEYYSERMVVRPFPNAVWIRGHWAWNDYAGRYLWVRGHWVSRYPQVVYAEPRVRHVPHGVAKGWWKKHGRVYAGME